MSDYRFAHRVTGDLDEIWEYIAKVSPAAANGQIDALFATFQRLAESPKIGQERDDIRKGVRVFSSGSYVVLFYPLAKGVEIIAVVHGARDWEMMFRR